MSFIFVHIVFVKCICLMNGICACTCRLHVVHVEAKVQKLMHCLNIEIDNAFMQMFTKQATTASGRDKCRSLDNNVTRAFSQSMTLIISWRDHKTHFEIFIEEVIFHAVEKFI